MSSERPAERASSSSTPALPAARPQRRGGGHPRTALAVLLGRASGGLARRLGVSGGTSLPGLVAQVTDPRLIRRLASQARHGAVVVTGTNGKTTTSGLVAYTLRAAGLRIWRNREGSNLARGIANTMLRNAGPTGLLEASGDGAFVLEVDEAAFARIATDLQPRVVLVTNLFRDQLDRYGEVDTVAEKWRDSLRQLPSTTILALNADDPAVAALGDGYAGPTLYYGVEQTPTHADSDSVAQVIDTRTCPRCRAPLTFAPRFYSHIGHWSCPKCGNRRPTPQVRATQVLSAGMDRSRFVLETPAGSSEVSVGLPGLYNIYNALAAATAGVAMQAPFEAIVQGLQQFTPAFGRAESIEVDGRKIRILLAKNPTGLNEVLRALASDTATGKKRLLMALNDRAADGEDVSWIWDADFEQLAGATSYLGACGTRAYDLALRMKYIGEAPKLVEPEIGVALMKAIEQTPPGETLYIIPTYTAMLAVRGELERRGFAPRYWEQEDA
ncbi:MAG TPA: Mur ligase family protein [Ktedonobacterales bacterium]